MRTLLITNSHDVTSDHMVRRLGSDKILRLNYDLIRDYDIRISADTITIRSAGLTVTGRDLKKAFWRKAFNGSEIYDKEFDSYDAAEYKYLLRELANIFERRGCLIFNKYDVANDFGKILQLYIAKDFFCTPNTRIISKKSSFAVEPGHIVKSLSSTPLDNKNVLYTTDVSGRTLKGGHLWQIQERVDADCDITVVYVYDTLFAYALERNSFEGLDWRKHIQSPDNNKWRPFDLTEEQASAIKAFMREIGWTFGRLDFLLSNGKLIFLEVNANGQWAWLDLDCSNGLFARMLECVDPATPMPKVQ